MTQRFLPSYPAYPGFLYPYSRTTVLCERERGRRGG
jgi:hypothetical protein